MPPFNETPRAESRQSAADSQRLGFHVTIQPDRYRPMELDPLDTTLPEFFEEFCAEPFRVERKDHAPGFLLARMRPCPASRCIGSGRDCGGGRMHRLNANVDSVTGLAIDLDDAPEDVASTAVDGLRARGLSFIAFNTFSHRSGSGTVRLRVVIPLHTEFPVSHPSTWSEHAYPTLLRAVGFHGLAAVDESSKDPARFSHVFSCAPDVVGHESIFVPGAPLDWRRYVDLSTVPPLAVLTPAPSADWQGAVDLADVKERLRRIHRGDWKLLLDRLLLGEPLVTKAERAAGAGVARENAWFAVTMALAMVRRDGEAKAAFLELCKESYATSVEDDPTGHTPWKKIEDRFERACAKAPALKADRQARQKARAAHVLARWKALQDGDVR